MSLPIRIRRARKKDFPLITNSWLKSFRDASWVRGCPNSVYYGYQHRIIEQLIPRSMVLCAVSEDDHNQIFGWIVAEVLKAGGEDSEERVLAVHYCYVKHPFRKLGIARQLLATLEATEQPILTMFTAKTPACGKLDLKRRGLVYNPFLALMSLPEDWADSRGEEPDETT